MSKKTCEIMLDVFLNDIRWNYTLIFRYVSTYTIYPFIFQYIPTISSVLEKTFLRKSVGKIKHAAVDGQNSWPFRVQISQRRGMLY